MVKQKDSFRDARECAGARASYLFSGENYRGRLVRKEEICPPTGEATG